MTEFHPSFVGLTGTQEQIDSVAKFYRIYVSKGDASEGDENDYLVDHSIFFFLMDPKGNFMDFFGRSMTAEDVASAVSNRVTQWRKDLKANRI